jgi:hypothetical protein
VTQNESLIFHAWPEARLWLPTPGAAGVVPGQPAAAVAEAGLAAFAGLLSQPAAPLINGIFPDTGASTEDGITNADVLFIFGTAAPDAYVELFTNGQTPTAVSADSNGAWSVILTTAELPADGAYSFTARQMPPGGVFSAFSAPALVTIDRTPPSPPSVAAVGEDSAGPFVTGTLRPLITGSFEPGSTITVSIDGVAQSVIVNGNQWSVTPSADLPLGPRQLTITATDAAGNETSVTSGFEVVDGIPPTAAGIALPAAGTYRAGQELTFVITLSEPVQLSPPNGALPVLQVVVGSQTLLAPMTLAGDATNLHFTLALPAGLDDPDGIGLGTVLFPGAALRDAAGNPWNGQLPATPGLANIRVDGGPPVATLAPAAGLIPAGGRLAITLEVNEPVTVAPGADPVTLSVAIGNTLREATLDLAASTATRLVFALTVPEGELDADGVAVGALSDPAGRITDAAGNTLEFDAGGAVLAGLRVDGIAPTASLSFPSDGALRLGEALSFTLLPSEPIAVAPGAAPIGLALSFGGTTRLATLDPAASTPDNLVFRYVVQPGDAAPGGIVVGALSEAGARLRDAAGNRLTFDNGTVELPGVTLDGVAPAATLVAPAEGLRAAGETLVFEFSLSEAVSFAPGAGSVTLTVGIGGVTRQATLDEAESNAQRLVFTLVVLAGDLAPGGIILGPILDPQRLITDAAGNPVSFGGAMLGTVRVDAVAPTATLETASGILRPGDTMTVALLVDEPVALAAGPQAVSLTLDIGGALRSAAFDPLASTATRLVFQRIVQEGEADADGIAVAALSDPGARLRDAAGNALSFANPGQVLPNLRVEPMAPPPPPPPLRRRASRRPR